MKQQELSFMEHERITTLKEEMQKFRDTDGSFSLLDLEKNVCNALVSCVGGSKLCKSFDWFNGKVLFIGYHVQVQKRGVFFNTVIPCNSFAAGKVIRICNHDSSKTGIMIRNGYDQLTIEQTINYLLRGNK